MSHPYSDLPAKAYWANSAGRDRFPSIWEPKFLIDAEADRFASVGSCFANHIGARLRANGLTWLACEAKREGSDPSHDSFGLGNIYTAKSFLYWLRAAERMESRADADAPGDVEAIFEDQVTWRHHDLLIAKTWEHGFKSGEEAVEHRMARIRAVRNLVRKTDVLIFTLGLTEGWEAPSGTPYPICPAVSFPGLPTESYRFVNYGYADVLDHLLAAVRSLHAINPEIRLLLTVSPVPLAATASGDHVIAATMYSKSVLRAAAEGCRAHFADVDYFPSYEVVVTSATTRDRFSSNRRSVTSTGVDLVMSHFFQAIGKESSGSLWSPCAAEPAETCDEARYGPSVMARPLGDIPVFVGSSQIRRLSEQFAEPHLTFTMNASNFVNQDFDDDPTWVFKPTAKEFAPHWSEFTGALQHQPFSEGGHTIITDFGCQSIWWTRELVGLSLKRNECLKIGHGSTPDIDQATRFVEILREQHLRILRALVRCRNRVIWIADPPFVKSNLEEIEGVLANLILQQGVTDIVRPRYLPFESRFPLRGDDEHHGSKYYYAMVAAYISGLI